LEKEAINRDNISDLFSDLDHALHKAGEYREITIFGSAAMMAQKLVRRSRETMDVDVADPDLDMAFQVIATNAAESRGHNLGWLNSSGVIYARNFPKGWQDRSRVVFEGTNLTVKSLSKRDLIATKFSALVGRNEARDLDDLLDLQPSSADLTRAKKWLWGFMKGLWKDQAQDFETRVRNAEEKFRKAKGHGIDR
jgi:hypothetical protein